MGVSIFGIVVVAGCEIGAGALLVGGIGAGEMGGLDVDSEGIGCLWDMGGTGFGMVACRMYVAVEDGYMGYEVGVGDERRHIGDWAVLHPDLAFFIELVQVCLFLLELSLALINHGVVISWGFLIVRASPPMRRPGVATTTF